MIYEKSLSANFVSPWLCFFGMYSNFSMYTRHCKWCIEKSLDLIFLPWGVFSFCLAGMIYLLMCQDLILRGLTSGFQILFSYISLSLRSKSLVCDVLLRHSFYEGLKSEMLPIVLNLLKLKYRTLSSQQEIADTRDATLI